MRYVEMLKEGDNVSDIYLVKSKHSAMTKNGKPYDNVVIQDKTGTLEAKIWEPNSGGIDDFDELDYVDFNGQVVSFNGQLQLNVKRARKCREGEYIPADYLPVSKKDIDKMYEELLAIVKSVKTIQLRMLLEDFFVKDEEIIDKFKKSSAAKSVHHGFVGGLLEHTLSVTKLCDFLATLYPNMNRDLLVSAAMLHDIGKLREISLFPENDYTDDGNLLGHIVIGYEMVSAKIKNIQGFPQKLASELLHCILAHHGELEFGSPKKPSIIEAVALSFADNTDAKLETMTEELSKTTETGWLGFNRYIESNIRKTSTV